MFQQLIEAIRIESSQSGGSGERLSQAHSYRGRMTSPGEKKAQLKALKKQSRQRGRAAASSGDDGFNSGKPRGNKPPKHQRPRYELGAIVRPISKRMRRHIEKQRAARDQG